MSHMERVGRDIKWKKQKREVYSVRGVDSDRRERWSTGSKRRRYDTVVKVGMQSIKNIVNIP